MLTVSYGSALRKRPILTALRSPSFLPLPFSSGRTSLSLSLPENRLTPAESNYRHRRRRSIRLGTAYKERPGGRFNRLNNFTTTIMKNIANSMRTSFTGWHFCKRLNKDRKGAQNSLPLNCHPGHSIEIGRKKKEGTFYSAHAQRLQRTEGEAVSCLAMAD